jgi:hypothetical protein
LLTARLQETMITRGITFMSFYVLILFFFSLFLATYDTFLFQLG